MGRACARLQLLARTSPRGCQRSTSVERSSGQVVWHTEIVPAGLMGADTSTADVNKDGQV